MKTLAWIACLLLTSCGSFRALVRDLNNENLMHDPAPDLVDGSWIGEQADVEGDWYLVAFLKPT